MRFNDRGGGEEVFPYLYKLCSNHWSNDTEMRLAMFSPSPRSRPLIPPIPIKNSQSKIQLETIVESHRIELALGVVDVERVNVPLMSMIERSPSLPALNVKEGGSASTVPAFLKRARSKIARSKSMQFMFH